jgi:uncharacterized protein Yka (UPF0111/DUF47 family)
MCVYFGNVRIFGGMKERLNLTIEGTLLDAIKAYASKRGISVSELVEDYFKKVTKPVQRENILDLVDSLDAPHIAAKADLKDLYYKEQGEKYGF